MKTIVPARPAPRKRSRAMANPAMTEITTEMIVAIVETTSVLRNHTKKFGVLNSVM